MENIPKHSLVNESSSSARVTFLHLVQIDLISSLETLEVFRNEILAAWQKDLNVETILISESMNSEIRIISNKIL